MAEFKGIDVSRWQGNIDFAKVKADGLKFAMLRSSYGKALDSKFRDNLSGAKAAGLDVGVYHFTTALTPAEAEAEIDWLFGQLDGEKLSYPVAFDMEDEKDRYTGKSKAELTAIAKAGLARIEKHGYYAMLYTNPNWLDNRFNAGELKAYDVWLANWRKTRPTSHEHGIWQYTSTGNVSGIGGNVDMDIAYKDYPGIMAYNGLNGYAKKPAVPAEPKEVTYIVKKGDTLSGIAAKYGTTYQALAAYNGIRNVNMIYVGQRIRIPQ